MSTMAIVPVISADPSGIAEPEAVDVSAAVVSAAVVSAAVSAARASETIASAVLVSIKADLPS